MKPATIPIGAKAIEAMIASASNIGSGLVGTIVGIVTFVLLKVIGFFLPLRVREEDERMGLDLALHGEALQ